MMEYIISSQDLRSRIVSYNSEPKKEQGLEIHLYEPKRYFWHSPDEC